MSENTNNPATTDDGSQQQQQPAAQPTAPKPEPPKQQQQSDQDKTDWQAEAKKWEKRAKDNVEKARRFDQIEQAWQGSKSESERLTEALNAAQQAAEKAQADALRYRIAAKHQINDADAELFLTGTDADTLERQAARLAEQITQGQPPRGYVPGEGSSPASPPALNSTGLEDAIKSKLGIT